MSAGTPSASRLRKRRSPRFEVRPKLSPPGEEPIPSKLDLAEDPDGVGHFWHEVKTQVAGVEKANGVRGVLG